MNILINNDKKIFSKDKFTAENLFNDDKTNVTYYRFKKNNVLNIALENREIFLDTEAIFFVLEGKIEFIFSNQKFTLEQNNSIKIVDPENFSLNILEDSKCLFITPVKVDSDNNVLALTNMVKIVEKKDRYTLNHNHRVGVYCNTIAISMDSNYDVTDLSLAATFHDLGKVDIDDEILNKKGQLTEEEYEIMKNHPVYSYEKLLPIYGEKIALIARHHHERLDGTGYPDHLLDEDISFEARVLAVADVFDALTSKRIYRDNYSFRKAIKIMRHDNGLDQDIVEVLEHLIKIKVIEKKLV